MSDLLYSWLNDEVQLSQKITNFEKDFSNGYFFGELLSKYNQQLNFNEFKNGDLIKAKINNFNLLLPTFKTLQVPFNTQIVEKIQKGEKDIATKILYQLKMALEKVTNPADVLIFSKTGKYNTVTPLKKIKPPKENYDKMETQFFSRRIQELNPGQKQVNILKHLQPFQEFKIREDEKIKKLRQKDEQDLKNQRDDIRKISLNKIQRNMAFMEDWQQKGVENGQKNHEIRRRREEADRNFKRKQEENKKNKLQKMSELTKQETYDEIANFEQSLRKQGIAPPIDDDLDDPEQEMELRKTGAENRSTLAQTMVPKLKESKQMSDWKRKERDKRRRKMIVDQQKIQKEIEVNKRKELVLEKLKQKSRQEKEIEYEIWRAEQCKDIIYKNRDLRDEKYREKVELNILNAKYKEEDMLKILQDEFQQDIQQKLVRQQEIQIQYKQKSRKENYQECNKMVEQILNLAEICHQHQQNTDSQEIDSNFWNDQIKLFIAEKDLIPNIQERHYDPINHVQEQQEEQYQDSKQYLADKELEDYIKGRGQWKPQHQEFHPEEGEENPEEKVIPGSPINNTILGDLIAKLLGQSYPQDLEKITKQLDTNPDLLAIKSVIYGYQFSGKHTLSEFLSKKYGITTIKMDILIQELLNLVQNPDLPAIQQQDQEGEDQENQKNEENSQEQQEYLEKQRELGQKIQNLLIQGEEITDELYIEVLMLKLNKLFPRENEQDFNEKYQKLELVVEDQANNNENQDDDVPLTQEDKFKNNLSNNKFKYTKGWVLLDFPHTYNQCKLLEKALSGFTTKDEQEKTDYELRIESMSQIVQASDIKVIKRELINGGIDLAFYLDIDKKESLRRALGRRIDRTTDIEYHMDENLPPIDNAPLVERLQQIQDFQNSENAIIDKNCELDQNFKDYEEWYKMFGFDHVTENVTTVMQQKARPVQQIVQEEEEEEVVEGNQKQQEELNKNEKSGNQQEQSKKSEGDKSKSEKLQKSNQSEQQQQQQDQQQQQQEENVDQVEENNVQKDTIEDQEKSVEMEEVEVVETQVEKIESWQKIDGSQKIYEVFYEVDKFIDILLRKKERQYKAINDKIENDKKSQEEQEELEKIKKENEGKLLMADNSDIQNQLQNLQAEFKLDDNSLQNLIKLWTQIENTYLKNTKSAFKQLRSQKEVILTRFSEIQRRFLELLQRPDNKFSLIRQFQEDYNQFVSENPDMCEEDVTKEELHQRVEDLHDQLFDIVESKKEDAIQERDQIMKQGWVENNLEFFCQYIQELIQAEIQRSFGCQQLIQDYYTLMDRGELKEPPEFYKQPLVQSQDQLPPVQEGDSFPRIEKLYDLAIGLSQGQVDEGAQDKKKGKQSKKDDKKAGKGKKGEEPEVVKEPTQNEIAMKQAIIAEKQILRYRLQVVKDFAVSKLQEYQLMTKILYNKLEDWLLYTNKCENHAIQEILHMFQENIENETKIQKELQLNYVDVIISHQVLNYLTPPPVILPAREHVKENRFTISQLYIIIEELKGIMSEQNFQIQSSVVLQLFTRKTINQLTKSELPQIWRDLKLKDYQDMILCLDRNSKGYVQGRDLCTYLCLLNADLVTQKQIQQYEQELVSQLNQNSNPKLSKDKFVNTPAPFDVSQITDLEENTNVFDRPKYIKELLFYINKDEETNQIDIQQFLHILSAVDYISSEESKKQLKNYNGLLFKQQQNE